MNPSPQGCRGQEAPANLISKWKRHHASVNGIKKECIMSYAYTDSPLLMLPLVLNQHACADGTSTASRAKRPVHTLPELTKTTTWTRSVGEHSSHRQPASFVSLRELCFPDVDWWIAGVRILALLKRRTLAVIFATRPSLSSWGNNQLLKK